MTGNAFAAIGIEDVLRHDLAASLDAASTGRRMPGKLVSPAHWHITVRFLGDAEDAVVDRFAHRLSEHLDARPGVVRCRGLGAFPSLGDAGVLYAAIDDPDGALPTIADQAEAAAVTAGLEPEGRPFRPHLTLSRLRPKRDVRPFARSFGDFSVRIPVREITVYRSEIGPDGLRYTELHRIPIEGPDRRRLPT